MALFNDVFFLQEIIEVASWIYRLKKPPCPVVGASDSGQGVPMVPGWNQC